MYKHTRDYYWKNGKPYGRETVDPTEASISYKIVSDPSFKRFSVEKYQFLMFEKVVYDSYLLDFRHLSVKDQVAWQREILKEEAHETIGLLHNQDDRAVLIEKLHYEENRCRSCSTSSIHGIPQELSFLMPKRGHHDERVRN